MFKEIKKFREVREEVIKVRIVVDEVREWGQVIERIFILRKMGRKIQQGFVQKIDMNRFFSFSGLFQLFGLEMIMRVMDKNVKRLN